MPPESRGLVLDAGAFIALEGGNPDVAARLRQAAVRRVPMVTSAGVVAQIWRGGTGVQVPVAFVLARTEVLDLTNARARSIGRMLGETGTADPIDAHVALIATERDWPILTSDPDDLLAIDPELDVERV